MLRILTDQVYQQLEALEPESVVRLLLNHMHHHNEVMEEISTALHMMGANQARAMLGQPPAYLADDFGFDTLIPRDVEEEKEEQ